MSVLSFFSWCENTSLGEAIRASRWLFPAIESVHLLALAVIGGAVLVMNLRLLGFGIKRQPAAQLWRDTWPWLMGSLTVMLISGMLLFTVMRKIALADPGRVGPAWGKVAALISLLLWSTVGVCGRWIGFS
jgi:hypothetical protein